MDEFEIAAILRNGPIYWTGLTFSCPNGLYVCDFMYFGEGRHFRKTTRVLNVGFLFFKTGADRRIGLTIIQHDKVMELSTLKDAGDCLGDTGTFLFLNGVVNSDERKERISASCRDGIPSANIVESGTCSYGPTQVGGEDAICLTPGYGSGGYDIYQSTGCHILDHKHLSSSIEGDEE